MLKHVISVVENSYFWVLIVFLLSAFVAIRLGGEGIDQANGLLKTAKELSSGVAASCITVLGIAAWKLAIVWSTRRKICAFFGDGIANGDVMVVVSDLRHRYGSSVSSLPRNPENISDKDVHAKVSASDLRAAGYVMQRIGGDTRKPIALVTDMENDHAAYKNDDINIICIALSSNHCTKKILDQLPAGVLKLEEDGDKSITVDREKFSRLDADDFALIVKVHPIGHPSRTWFLCGGMKAGGTTGAGYFLSHRWKELYDFRIEDGMLLKGDMFIAVLRVPGSREKSARIVKIFRFERSQ